MTGCYKARIICCSRLIAGSPKRIPALTVFAGKGQTRCGARSMQTTLLQIKRFYRLQYNLLDLEQLKTIRMVLLFFLFSFFHCTLNQTESTLQWKSRLDSRVRPFCRRMQLAEFRCKSAKQVVGKKMKLSILVHCIATWFTERPSFVQICFT